MEKEFVDDIMRFTDDVNEETREAYTDAILKFPKSWLGHFQADRYAIEVQKQQVTENDCIKLFNEDHFVIVFQISAHANALISLCSVFCSYIKFVYEEYETSSKYQEIVMKERNALKEYSDKAKIYKDSSYIRFDRFYALMLYGYLSEDEKFTQNPKLQESNEYVSDWMTEKVFMINSYDMYDNFFVGPRVTRGSLETISYFYENCIPFQTKEILESRGVRIIITNSKSSKTLHNFCIRGYYGHKRGEIIIKTGFEINETFYHELGHFFTSIFLDDESISTVKKLNLEHLFQTEKAKWSKVYPDNSEYYTSNFEEYFAQSIAYYVQGIKGLENIPSTYDKVKEMIERYWR